MRKKLIELIDEYLYPSSAGGMADHLIANGVTIPVRCRDCRNCMLWCKPVGEVIGECFIRKMNSEDEQFCMVGADDFCSYGERKDNEIQT